MDAAGKASIHRCIQVFAASRCFSTYTFQSFFFISDMSDLKCCHMKHEVETDRHSNPQDTLDAEKGSTTNGGEFKKFESSRSSKGCQSENEGGQAGASDPSNSSNTSNSSNPTSELEERVRADCRRTCRRNFWIELFKSAAKIAGVVLAALGLSSFNEEN